MPSLRTPPRPRSVFTVSELTGQIKDLLESSFDFIWITGEISNHRVPSSGHHYFTLKDAAAQISAVMFRGAARALPFALEDGVRVTGMGRVSVYPPRGNYQIILEYMAPDGLGALQLAFEQLKGRLAEEGLFESSRKRPLPLLPRHVTLVTSPSGAVVHDFLNIADRRFPGLPMAVVPVSVQGTGADGDIVAAIAFINRAVDTDVIVVCRGGGSLEDLQPFNTEIVARAIAGSRIPVVSAVGHETDVTIADFAADLRAPTPSAAAEIVVPQRRELERTLAQCRQTMVRQVRRRIDSRRAALDGMHRRLGNPRRHLSDLMLRLDDLGQRMQRAVRSRLRQQRETLGWHARQLNAARLHGSISKHHETLQGYSINLLKNIANIITRHRRRIDRCAGMLSALDPDAVLQRGYSITRRCVDGRIVKQAGDLGPGDAVTVTLARGRFDGKVTGVHMSKDG